MSAQREMHGLSHGPDGKRTSLHRLWLNIRNRCNNPKTPDYKYYGALGIRVCARWDRFVDFVADVGPHPGNGLTLDRKDTNGHYEPGNVRWATRQTQARNRNYCTLTEADAAMIRQLYGRGAIDPDYVPQAELARRFGVTQGLVSQIVRGASWK